MVEIRKGYAFFTLKATIGLQFETAEGFVSNYRLLKINHDKALCLCIEYNDNLSLFYTLLLYCSTSF